jgi:D-alanyl-lipoteichoic acid acyltransferase DltB (MBOAT superfamily)
MLFNTFGFIFAFLPIVLAGFFTIARCSQHWAAVWLAIASLAFYSIWDYHYLPLLLISIIANFGASGAILNATWTSRKPILVAAIAANLALLAYFKYANFFISSVNQVAGADVVQPMHIILPIGISFFTFTQIAFLVDTYQGKVSEYKFSHYLLFVTYFPHLIAGPVLHHKEMMPQFKDHATYRLSWESVAVGMTMFVIGLAKKVLLADNIAPMANPVFEPGAHPGLIEAWVGTIAYSLQLYFDFSGYSDMAVGLSQLFGVRLPFNFDSPYKARNIIDFWRRWHMTLSRFLRDYLYIPMGGSRNGPVARYRNLIVTMLLGGLWHGAGWTFVLWGGLHGLYIAVNHYWHFLRRKFGWEKSYGTLGAWSAHVLTLLAVMIAWVFFRAIDVTAARDVLAGMSGLNGIDLPAWSKAKLGWLAATGAQLRFEGIRWIDFGSLMHLPLLLLGVLLALFFPNSQEIMSGLRPQFQPASRALRNQLILWRPNWTWVSIVSVVFLACVFSLNRATEFLYFQF